MKYINKKILGASMSRIMKTNTGGKMRYDPVPECEGVIAARESLEPEGGLM